MNLWDSCNRCLADIRTSYREAGQKARKGLETLNVKGAEPSVSHRTLHISPSCFTHDITVQGQYLVYHPVEVKL
jgi:hypothetical protein